jgi:cytosine/adenosine deaminase-related metal-dependent hydrolase
MDGSVFFGQAGILNFLPAGWEKVAAELSKAQDEALAKQAPALAAEIARPVQGPLAFRNVKLYDADMRKFRDAMTVVVGNGKIQAVGSTSATEIPAGAQIIDGSGKTLVPGLWDNHQHYGDDSTGPLLLATGITSVRDPGNQIEELLARKKRIESGQLLGPRILPSMLIDGSGPYTAQVAVVVKNLDEALAAVRRAKDSGYFGIKLYGTIDPAWVKPMADLAHQLGLRVHGHIPHGMRPLDAVRAGYDEVTHINFVMMQAMPDDVVATSNGMNRFIGTGKYAADVDVHSPQMSSFLDELATRHIAVDPTVVTFESLYVPDRGSMPPAEAPYADTLPPQLSRAFLSGGMAPPPDLTRERMRASFAKLDALIPELYKRHIPVLAGTDGFGFDLIRELELYVNAGMTSEDALATATIIPAQTFHLGDQTGSLAQGKLAELVLIDGDPSKNIGDLRQVELVMRDGKLMKASELRAAIGISGPPKRSQ